MKNRKQCLVCNSFFYKKKNYSKTQWGNRRYCSKPCGLIAINKSPSKSVEDRFFSKVKVYESDKCWPWHGSTNKGYGQLSVNGKPKPAHRVSWEIHKSTIPDGMLVRHLCNNPNCVNPNHLMLGTHKENSNDSIVSNRTGFKGNALLNSREVKLIKACLSFGLSVSNISNICGVDYRCISNIKNNKTYKSV